MVMVLINRHPASVGGMIINQISRTFEVVALNVVTGLVIWVTFCSDWPVL